MCSEEGEFAQILAPNGDLARGDARSDQSALSAEQRAASLEGWLESTTEALPVGEDEIEPVRLLGRPADDGVTVVVGVSLADVADALELLLAQLVIGGIAALALTPA